MTIQILEYANTQLLEFRHYDSLLTQLLDGVYRSLERKTTAWRLSREAARLNTIRLDVMELTEKVDNAIKFLSDMFYARAYRIAASRVGVPDCARVRDARLARAGLAGVASASSCSMPVVMPAVSTSMSGAPS